MKRKIAKPEAKIFDSLKNAGLEFETPQDELTYQPDSGSVADGLIGKQEYGIDIDLDAQSREEEELAKRGELEHPTTPVPGQSEWSQRHRFPRKSAFDKKLTLMVVLFC